METGKALRRLISDLHAVKGTWGAVALSLGTTERNLRLVLARSDEELAGYWPRYREKALTAAREAGLEPVLYDGEVVLWDPRLSFERNLNLAIEAPPLPVRPFRDLGVTLLGFRLNSPFGSPASVLTANADRIRFLARTGCDLLTYKTVRSRVTHSHPTPNILLVLDRIARLEPDRPIPPILVADSLECDDWISAVKGMLNRYGMPSLAPNAWQADVENAIRTLTDGQQLIVSIVGTLEPGDGPEAYVEDFVRVAKLAREAGAKIVEPNLSCPNAGKEGELYRDTELATRVCAAIRAEIPDVPIIAKIGYLPTHQLRELVVAIAPHVNGITAVNTIPAEGQREGLGGRVPAFLVPGLKAGLSGGPIHGYALKCIRDLVQIREEEGLKDLAVIGVGGVTEPSEVHALLGLGADAVQAATVFYEDAYFGVRVRRYLEEQYLSRKLSLEEQLRLEHWNWSEAVRQKDGLKLSKAGLVIANDIWFEHESRVRETASRGPRSSLPPKTVADFTDLLTTRLG